VDIQDATVCLLEKKCTFLDGYYLTQPEQVFKQKL